MSNPYKITEPAAISFSGGRTSGYMLWKILDAYDGQLPDHLPVTFANTGKEMTQTLDFVQACSVHWGVDITWLECLARPGGEDENKYVYETKEVDYESASRDGEPFDSLIVARQYLPNPVARFCTQELKVYRIRDWMKNKFGDTDWSNVIGIRADEQRRAAKLRKEPRNILPLVDDNVYVKEVYEFWTEQNFDLELPNNNGVTDWGNCDLCFLKGFNKKLSIVQARPDLVDWWSEMETKVGKGQKAGTFRSDQPSYSDMKMIATDQGSLFDYDDETIPCFCGD